jgi:hypothetical protein
MAGTQTSGRTCNGNGTCSDPTVKSCDQYVCGPTACKISCMMDGDCISGDYCDGGGNCQPRKLPGKSCGVTDECAAGVCSAQGVCCDSTCDGMCMTCKDPVAPGTCRPDTTSPGCIAPPPPPPDAGVSI